MLRIRYGRNGFKCHIRQKALKLLIVLLLFIFGYAFLPSLMTPWTFRHLTSEDEHKYPPLEPDLVDDFPIDNTDVTAPRIPHIIHQTARTTTVKSSVKSYIQSFIHHNPAWQYYFWTDSSARQLIEDRHPYLLKLWDSYGKGINRGDALRYVVLYEFGGVYADLDMESLRPLDRVTLKYSCVIPPEPFEHSIFRLNVPFLLSNAFMMCRPKHPFFKYILQNIVHFQPMAEQIDTAGPSFLTSQFMSYNNFSKDDYHRESFNESNSSPYFYKGRLPPVDNAAVYIPNTNYFINTLDLHYPSLPEYYRVCNKYTSLSNLRKRACTVLYRRLYVKREFTFEYTVHHWFQSYLNKYSLNRNLDICDIIPHCRLYGGVKVTDTNVFANIL